jgi:stage V sporulation protein G
MQITEIRVFQKEGQDKKLKAYTTVTFDDVFVVRNIKIIQGSNGLFIAMPSRKMKRLCPKCYFKNEVGSNFCNHCGTPIKSEDPTAELVDTKIEHRDIAHPITQQFREYLQTKILETYEKEIVAGGGSSASAEEVSSEVH